MSTSLHLLRFGVASLFVLLTILPAKESFAQWGGGSGMSGMSGMPGSRRGGNRNNSNADSSTSSSSGNMTVTTPKDFLLTYEQIETRLSQLEESLKLSSDQTKAWGNFATKVRLYASDVAKERARLGNDNPSAPDALRYLNQSSENAKSRYTSLKEVEDTAKPLYKLLNSEQKVIFDNKIPTFIAAIPKKLSSNQPNYNLPDLGGVPPPNQNSSSSTLPGYTHQ